MNNRLADPNRLKAALHQVLNSFRALSIIDFPLYVTIRDKVDKDVEAAARQLADVLQHIMTINVGD